MARWQGLVAVPLAALTMSMAGPAQPSAPRAVRFSRPPASPEELERLGEAMQRFDRVVEDAIRTHVRDPRDLAAVCAYRDEAARKLFVVSNASSRGRTGAAVTFRVKWRTDTGESWIEDVIPTIDLDFADELSARAEKGDTLSLDLLHALLVKEGATIVSVLADPTLMVEHSALSEAFRARPFDARDPAARETALRLVAHEVEGEAIGYRAAVDFLRRSGIEAETLRGAAGREEDFWHRMMMTIFGDLLERREDETDGPSLTFQSRLFELEATELANEPVRAVVDILESEGAAARHPRTGQVLVSDAALGFLVDPRYVRGGVEPEPAAQDPAPSPTWRWWPWWCVGLATAVVVTLFIGLRRWRSRAPSRAT